MTMYKAAVLFTCIVTMSLAALSQDAFKCNIGGKMVYQDRPCQAAQRRSGDLPNNSSQDTSSSARTNTSPSGEAERIREKTKQDADYVTRRIAERNHEREKDEALFRIQQCEAQAAEINRRISDIDSSSPQGTPVNIGSAVALQLDQERRQTAIASLQAQASAKHRECDQLNAYYRSKYLR